MGGRTAVRFANLYPERTLSVIVEDMHMMGRRTPWPDKTALSWAIAQLRSQTYSSFEEAAQSAENLFNKPLDERTLKRLGLVKKRGKNIWLFTANPNVPLYESQGLQEDLTGALQSIRVPSLFIAADPKREPVLFGKGLEHLEANQPNAQAVIVVGANHSIHHTQLDQYVDSVEDFLEQHHLAPPN